MQEFLTSDCNSIELNMEALIRAIKQKKCILMLGPDTATEIIDGKPISLSKTLSKRLSEKLKPEILEKINTFDLTQVSQHYYLAHDHNDLEDQVLSFFKEKQNLCSQLHRDLASLPFYFTITTTPDSMFINALTDEQKQPITGYYNFNGKNPETIEMGTEKKPLVYYLFGSVKEPDSLLLTEYDLLDFLAWLMAGKRPLPENIRSELKSEEKIFLFLGFGFRHWYLRILMHILQGRYKRKNRSFALEKESLEHTSELQNAVFFFRNSDYRIHILNGDYNDFTSKLLERFINCSSNIDTIISPRVFICYAREDKKYTEYLYEKLEKNGIRPWMDTNDIGGGEEWREIIKTQIEKTDYFLILLSKSFITKKNTFIEDEIRLAFERLKRDFLGTNTVYIIPVKTEECSLREDLEKFQTVDLTNNSSIDKLINEIQRNYEKKRIRIE